MPNERINQMNSPAENRPPETLPSGAPQDMLLIFQVFALVAAIWMFGIVAYAAATSPDRIAWLATVGSAILIGGAHAWAGGIAGFLFAIPRSRQHEVPAQSNDDKAEKDNGRKYVSDYSANTNLEQISDWLTKILVGAGLVEIAQIKEHFSSLATMLAPAIGGPAAKPVVLSLMGFSLCWGFCFIYLFTRLWMPKALSRAEREEQSQQFEVQRAAELRSLERRTYNLLYDNPPSGYAQAIDAIETYYGRSGSLPSSWLWLYLACAYGQKHAFEKPAPGSDADRVIRERTRNAVEQASKLNSSAKDILARLYEGNDPGEDDLKTLNPDSEIEALLK